MQEKIENLIWITKKSHVVLIAKDHLVTTNPPIDIDNNAHTMIKNALLFMTMLEKWLRMSSCECIIVPLWCSL